MASESSVAGVGTGEKQVIVVGIDEGEHSEYALQWTLDHFFADARSRPPVFSLVVVYARPFPTSVANLRTIAAGVAERVKQLCESRSVGDALVEMVEGDAREVLCDAVKRHQATVLVVGSHGYGSIKRAFLGSVSDHCAHQANCTVMIVKKPQPSK
ncbi:unnamed protein product [Spirodela intermedia]|uniref:UspA domain-containing protein n=1 Tax=Spirodela intermedia TaxID=51605 RepID=A0A7I8KQ07_SPIIN|nr:unnamed protein product [Spirodela intermedia]